MINNLKGRDILSTGDWAKSELDQVVDLALKFKQMGVSSRSLDILKGKTLLLLFFRSSTRTRISFTAAMEQLGGFVQCPDPGNLQLSLEEKPGAGESLKDTAKVLEKYVDAVGIRIRGPLPDKNGEPKPGFGDAILRKWADLTTLPIINLSSCLNHPTQALADIMVMKENLDDLRGKKIVCMWAYSPILRGQPMPLSDALISAAYGMNVTMVYPEGYDLDASAISHIKEEVDANRAKFEILRDYKRALESADVVFSRNWWSSRYYTNTKEEELHLAGQHKDWKLTEKLLKLTNNARIINCMPFDRGNEMDDSVIDGPNSIIYEEAENLLHVRKALLTLLLSDEVTI